ncbi:MAG: polyprenyl synthetase family protein [Dehalococcoidia bacterium]|nr:polyprenyl synthetase family protein [Dehalococcoidia bacterium]
MCRRMTTATIVADALDQHAAAVRSEMERLLVGRTVALYDMLRYHLGWVDASGNPIVADGGKALRSALCLLAAQAVGGDPGRAMPAAAALELVHNFSLIHDDVMDGSPRRRSRPTVWKLWGRAHAITAGDAMFSLAHQAVWSLAGRGATPSEMASVGCLLDETCLRLCEGQYLDVEFEGKLSVSTEAYLIMIQGKTGALMQAACQAGALLGRGSQAQVEAFSLVGQRLGEAFQIRDDILGIWGQAETMGKPVAEDIKSKKQALPIALALETANASQRAELTRVYTQKRVFARDVATVLTIFDELQVQTTAQQIAADAAAAAQRALDTTGLQNQAIDQIRALITFAVERER